MSEREQYQAGVPCWVDTSQPDPEAALVFYGELFGWEFDGPGQMTGDPPGRYYVARVRGRDVAGVSSLPSGGLDTEPGWNTYVAVDGADEAAQRATRAGGSVIVGPLDAPPAGRLAVLADPAGAVFCVWEGHQRRGAQIVNEPAAWSMSALSTRDPSASAAFYAELFGWETDEFEMGGAEIKLFRLPGYVGGEPHQPVPRDVVGVMMPLADETRGPQWSVDFWVGDADAAAATAAKRGGTVIAGPHDTPMFRSAVIADPHGVALSISQLKLDG